jgi:hypothetical protein
MPDATITSTASTFGTISGVFSADQSTISGTISGIVPGTLTGSVGVPGPAGPAGIGLPAGGTSGQFLQKTSGVDYATDWVTVNLTGLATESWVTAGFYPLTGNPSGFLTASSLTPYLTKADNLASVASPSSARTNLGLGTLDTPTFAGVTVQGSGANVANLTPTSLSLTHVSSGSFTIQPSVGITFPDASVQTTAFTGIPSAYISSVSSPLSVTSGNLSVDLSAYLTSATAASTYQTLSGMSSYLTTSAAASTYQTLAGMSDYLAKAGNLAGLANTGTARTNLGLGSLAVVNDAPSDGSQYARKNAAWDVVIPGDRYLTTSTTSNTVSNGNKTFTIGTGLSYTPTQNITISYDASNHMHGEVLTYNSGTGVLTVDINHHTGSGTYAAWVVNVGGVTPATSVAWGAITGTLSSQTDLVTALGTKRSVNASVPIPSGESLIINDGGIHPNDVIADNNGFYIRNGTTFAEVATFRTDQVLIPSVGITFSDATNQTTAGLSPATAASTYYLQTNPAGYITSAAIAGLAPLASPALTGNVTITSNSSGAALFIEQSGTGNILTLHDQASDTSFVAIDQNGKVNTIPSTTANAGFNVPHGTAPTTPVNGDIWTTTTGLFMRMNGVTKQYVDFDTSQTINGNKTFSNANLTLGNSTAAGTINIGTGATLTATTKAINIGTNGVSGSTTNVTVGSSVAGSGVNVTVNGALTTTGATQTIGNSTAASTLNLATGATLTATTKAVNIGTNGVAGSTTNIAIGSTTGTSTTTLQGTTNGVTAAADTNSVALATTAYVVGQAGSATPLVDGTAAVGTSLRYARQDHVHPTDTTRAPLASPALTGTPTAPTATAGTNTTQIATTAFVTAAVPAVATASQARTFTNNTTAMSPRQVLWSMLSQDFIDIAGPSMTVTNTGTITSVTVGQLSRVIRPGNAGACSSRIRTFGTSQVDQTWTASSRPQPASFLNFSLRSIHSGRSTTGGVTDANYTCAVYYGKAEADGVGNLTRRGYGWKMVGGAGSRFLELQAHNGTTLSSVTSSFAVTAGVAFDWDIESDGAGNVTLYVNGSSVATSTGGPTGSVNITAVAWQEEVVAAAALSSPFMDFVNSRGRYIVINTW